MATRNLTKAFVGVRNATKANKQLNRVRDSSTDSADETDVLHTGSDSVNWKAVKESLPPVWVDKIEKTEEDILKIQLKMRELSALHTKRLLVNFKTDETQQEREIDMKTQEITEVFRHAEGLLKKFSRQGDEESISASERTVRKNMQSSIAKKIQALSMSFRATQKEYMTKLQAQKSGSGEQGFEFMSVTESKASASSSGGLGGGSSSVDMSDYGFTTAQMTVVDETEELVNQRDEEITKIAKSIEELAAIFKELAVLVIDQGTILDRIDFNMETAVEHAKEGIVQLQKAEDHQKNALPFRCIVLLVVLIAIMLGVLVYKHSGKNK